MFNIAMVFIGGVFLFIISNLIYELSKKLLTSKEVILKVLDKKWHMGSTSHVNGQINKSADKYSLYLEYNGLVQRVYVSRRIYMNTDIGEEIPGYYRTYRDLFSKEIERLELK